MNTPLNPHLRQANVIASAFCPQDLRIGNVLNYDTEEEGIGLTVIDWQDLKWLSEDPESFNKKHSPMPLTEENLKKLGFEKHTGVDKVFGHYSRYISGKRYFIHIDNFDFNIVNSMGMFLTICKIKSVHELQNFAYSLTGQMLSLS